MWNDIWNNIVFWRIAALVTAAFLITISIFFYRKVKKIEKDYNDSINEAQRVLDQAKETEGSFKTRLQDSISTLVELLLILNNWAITKDPSRKLEFQETKSKLPEEIRELIKTKF